MFRGFNIVAPEYEVVCPQTKHTYNVRSLNVQEEERMKGSLMTPVKITEHLSRCIYDAIVNKPEGGYEWFLKNTTLPDRDCILYGLYHITYGEVRNYDVACSECGHEHSVTIDASSTFNYNQYSGKDILTKIVKVPLPKSEGVTVHLKQPTLQDEITSIKNLSQRPGTTIEIITETLIIDRFTQDILEKKTPVTYKERDDIIDAYKDLPAMDKREIHKKYNENLGKYRVDLKMNCNCPKCSHVDEVEIDLAEQFFRMVFTS